MKNVGRALALTACQLGLVTLAFGAGCCPPSTNQRVFNAASSVGDDAPEEGQVLRGDASYYASFFSGRRTSSGERYDPRKLTAANRRLPFGTRLRVTRVDTGRSVVVRVNDRGPFGKRHRILDLSRAAAEQLDMIGRGHAEVEAVVLK
ncbi:MAG TPA: septal ring lytic transglycosylase RlpA family protein [Polyangiales bacterium]|nr:septal ring lytic transglycosylase RlpA family protein [Polyangiales bacterium]